MRLTVDWRSSDLVTQSTQMTIEKGQVKGTTGAQVHPCLKKYKHKLAGHAAVKGTVFFA